jgi:hypothetical protein
VLVAWPRGCGSAPGLAIHAPPPYPAAIFGTLALISCVDCVSDVLCLSPGQVVVAVGFRRSRVDGGGGASWSPILGLQVRIMSSTFQRPYRYG